MARIDLSRLGLGLAAVARPAYITSGRGADLGDDRGVERLRGRTRELLDAPERSGLRLAGRPGPAVIDLCGAVGAMAGTDHPPQIDHAPGTRVRDRSTVGPVTQAGGRPIVQPVTSRSAICQQAGA